ncbi:MAG TPA: hypothetical protein PLA50_16215 [Bacteroidia bacterium]|nr:hypothetical protein [Bacteroidia bacterium]
MIDQSPRHSAAALLRDFTDALAQQMFYWGRDVIHSSGNLLVAYGFDRRKSEGLDGTSCYRKTLGEGCVELHGACAGWYPGVAGESAFLYIRNRRCCYAYDGEEPPAPGIYCDDFLRTVPVGERVRLSQRFLDWWLDYEQWIAGVTGPGYRDACHRAFAKLPKSTPWLPPAQGMAWLRAYREDPERAGRARRRNRNRTARTR